MPAANPAQVLEHSGWARSVGGSNPYITLFSRAGTSRERADAAAANLEIHELPSARGCTYVVPAADFEVALKVGQSVGDSQEISMAKKNLGVTDAEIDRLCRAICDSLDKGTKDPTALKNDVGDAVRHLGDEGKKRGMTNTLGLGLGLLQSLGEIRRVPVNGRLDQQKYAYTRWGLKLTISREEAFDRLARAYFRWIGPASYTNFQWFSGLGVKAAKEVLDPIGLKQLGDTGMFLLPEDHDSLASFKPPAEPKYALTTMLDGILLHKRDTRALLDTADLQRHTISEKGLLELGSVMDLSNNAIFDRGRIIGLWEYDTFAKEIVKILFVQQNADLDGAIQKTEGFIRDQLGDARSFSLDSPESRKPTIERLRAMAPG